jgi:hypothetical protein
VIAERPPQRRMMLDRIRSSFSATRPAACVLSLLLLAGRLPAQRNRAPSLVFEPGVMTVNAVSAPLPSGSSTGLNLRFLAVVPTSIPWLSVEVGTSFAPLGLSNGLRDLNEPTFFYGPTIMLLPRDRTSNWIELSLPVLGAYRLDETGEAERLYVNDLVVQGTAMFPVGQKLMADMGPFWSRLTMYGILEQNLTPSRNVATRKVDRVNPTFLYGISIPIHSPKDPARAP